MDHQSSFKSIKNQDVVAHAWQQFERTGTIADYINYLDQQRANNVLQNDLSMGEADPCLSKHRELF